jgi:hypothetical protein
VTTDDGRTEPTPAAGSRSATGDVEPPPGGGVMRRLSAGSTGMAGVFSIVDQVFAPTRDDARRELEEQHSAPAPAPAPTDPPALGPSGGPGASDRFRGRIVIRRPDAAGEEPAPPVS